MSQKVDLEALERSVGSMERFPVLDRDTYDRLLAEVRAGREAREEMERAWKESQHGWLDEIAKAKVELANETQQVADARQQLYDTNEAHNDIVAENTRIREERDAYGAENAQLREVLEKAINAQHEVQPDTVSGDVVSEGWEMCLSCAFDGWPCENRACWVYQASAALASPSVPPPQEKGQEAGGTPAPPIRCECEECVQGDLVCTLTEGVQGCAHCGKNLCHTCRLLHPDFEPVPKQSSWRTSQLCLFGLPLPP